MRCCRKETRAGRKSYEVLYLIRRKQGVVYGTHIHRVSGTIVNVEHPDKLAKLIRKGWSTFCKQEGAFK
jgi:hypothetical protein